MCFAWFHYGMEKGGYDRFKQATFQMKWFILNYCRWWFQIFFYFHPYLGKIPILTNIFSDRLKPPTSKVCLIFLLQAAGN